MSAPGVGPRVPEDSSSKQTPARKATGKRGSKDLTGQKEAKLPESVATPQGRTYGLAPQPLSEVRPRYGVRSKGADGKTEEKTDVLGQAQLGVGDKGPQTQYSDVSQTKPRAPQAPGEYGYIPGGTVVGEKPRAPQAPGEYGYIPGDTVVGEKPRAPQAPGEYGYIPGDTVVGEKPRAPQAPGEYGYIPGGTVNETGPAPYGFIPTKVGAAPTGGSVPKPTAEEIKNRGYKAVPLEPNYGLMPSGVPSPGTAGGSVPKPTAEEIKNRGYKAVPLEPNYGLMPSGVPSPGTAGGSVSKPTAEEIKNRGYKAVPLEPTPTGRYAAAPHQPTPSSTPSGLYAAAPHQPTPSSTPSGLYAAAPHQPTPSSTPSGLYAAAPSNQYASAPHQKTPLGKLLADAKNVWTDYKSGSKSFSDVKDAISGVDRFLETKKKALNQGEGLKILGGEKKMLQTLKSDAQLELVRIAIEVHKNDSDLQKAFNNCSNNLQKIWSGALPSDISEQLNAIKNQIPGSGQ